MLERMDGGWRQAVVTYRLPNTVPATQKGYPNPIKLHQPNVVVVSKTIMTGEAGKIEKPSDAPAGESEEPLDWVLTKVDEERSEPQSIDEELERLRVLRSYLILDSEREFPFERLTALASRVFDAPIALVSLVDLGRQWFMSNRGLGDVRETPRSHAFCAHAIISKDDLFIIKDASKDPRFMNNPLVTSAPNIRFYAGAPLLAPEGYKLGTFCIIDNKPRPGGLDLDEKQNLRELSALAIQVIVARRRKRERDCENNSQLIACTAHDLLTPLSGIELSLSLLNQDEEFQQRLSKIHKDAMEMASTCSSVLQEMCKSVRSTFSQNKSAFEQSFGQSQVEKVKIDDLVNKVYAVLDPIPKKVPVKIKVDEDVPLEILSDGAKILRCTMNYLTVACARTQEGLVAVRVYVKRDADDGRPCLVVKCEDTAPGVDLSTYQYLFKSLTSGVKYMQDSIAENNQLINLELALFSVACQMNVVGGSFGFRPRSMDDEGCTEFDKGGAVPVGSVFWFSIPFGEIAKKPEPKETTKDTDTELTRKESAITHAEASEFIKTVATITGFTEEKPITKNSIIERQRRALVIEDSTIVRRMLTKSLSKHGFVVSQAENGMEGLEELKGTLFDLVMCDFLMPIMDGLDCVQQYRDWEKIHRPWISQRIIGISAHASKADVEKGLTFGMNDFRPKPVTLKLLSELIETEDQISMSKRLDEIESNQMLAAEKDGERQKKRLKTASADAQDGSTIIDRSKKFTCLVLFGPSTATRNKLVQDTIKGCGWQCAAGSSYVEVMNFLTMRTWDVVLVDESYSSLILDFREWESRRRTERQPLIVVSESVNQMSPDQSSIVQTPQGFDHIIGKPLCLNALKNLLQQTATSLLTQNGDGA